MADTARPSSLFFAASLFLCALLGIYCNPGISAVGFVLMLLLALALLGILLWVLFWVHMSNFLLPKRVEDLRVQIVFAFFLFFGEATLTKFCDLETMPFACAMLSLTLAVFFLLILFHFPNDLELFRLLISLASHVSTSPRAFGFGVIECMALCFLLVLVILKIYLEHIHVRPPSPRRNGKRRHSHMATIPSIHIQVFHLCLLLGILKKTSILFLLKHCFREEEGMEFKLAMEMGEAVKKQEIMVGKEEQQ